MTQINSTRTVLRPQLDPGWFSKRNDAPLCECNKSTQVQTRYSPAQITGIEKIPRFGNPDESKISTSYSERLNLSVRMHVRRFTRLTNAHSKTYRHHAAMMALFVARYNYCRKNLAVKNDTPAMAADLADHGWTVKQLLTESAGGE